MLWRCCVVCLSVVVVIGVLECCGGVLGVLGMLTARSFRILTAPHSTTPLTHSPHSPTPLTHPPHLITANHRLSPLTITCDHPPTTTNHLSPTVTNCHHLRPPPPTNNHHLTPLTTTCQSPPVTTNNHLSATTCYHLTPGAVHIYL